MSISSAENALLVEREKDRVCGISPYGLEVKWWRLSLSQSLGIKGRL